MRVKLDLRESFLLFLGFLWLLFGDNFVSQRFHCRTFSMEIMFESSIVIKQ